MEIDSAGLGHMAFEKTVQGAGAGTAIMPGLGSVIGAGIGAVGGLAGGVLSNTFNNRAADTAWERQKEALQNTIQWRVADAKKAGIHPLYALGAQPMSSGAIPVMDTLGGQLANASQNIGNVIARQMSPTDKTVAAIELDNLYAQNLYNRSKAKLAQNDAILSDWNLESVRMGGQPNDLGLHHDTNPMGQSPNPPGSGVPMSQLESVGRGELGYYNVQPSKYTSGSSFAPGWEAKAKEGMQEWRLRPGFYVSMPYSDEGIGEQLSQMSPREKMQMIIANAGLYGPGYASDAVNYFVFGIEPRGKYRSVAEKGIDPRWGIRSKAEGMMKRFRDQIRGAQ